MFLHSSNLAITVFGQGILTQKNALARWNSNTGSGKEFGTKPAKKEYLPMLTAPQNHFNYELSKKITPN